MVAGRRVCGLSVEGTLPVTMEASLVSLTQLRVPVSASAVGVAVPRIPRTDTRAALACPTTVDVVVVGGSGSRPPSCASLTAGHASTAIASATAIERLLRDLV